MITLTFAGDEAGDVSLSFNKGASRYFVPAFISTQFPDDLRQTLSNLRQTLDLRETHEFKFHKMASAEVRNQVFSALAHAKFDAWALIVDKTRLPKIFETTESIEIYTHFITELLDIIPAELQKGATLILDEFGSTPDLRTELRRAMLKRHMPRLFKRVIVRSSHRESLIQVADLVAGAVMRRDSQNDSEAFDMISRKIKRLELYRPY
ncbi:MAG: DUF3800 domain-containing protein [Anaerolineae bacterium]|nr:DUF3800 domain-containing protein [Anaerolineae bacterium]MBL8104658.1 DUF3800 domain-containing protein [Anaerolineales bacterium]MCC7188857.1 DUF3800 domain-containing protein [Anaerolineales bacterium]